MGGTAIYLVYAFKKEESTTMNQISEQKFLQALAICKSLVKVQKQPSHLPCEAINLFCDIAQKPDELLHL